MSHLSLESLARLVDETARADEATHLEACRRCRLELERLRRQSEELGRLDPPAPPAGAWRALASRLEAEGLLSDEGPGLHSPRLAASRWRKLPRLAAAVALFLLGAATGAAWSGAPGSPGLPAGAGSALDLPQPQASTADEASELVRLAEAAYLDAVSGYLEFAEPAELPDPVARLAALESIVLTTAEALTHAPADPVINGYHLTAVAQREAMLQRLLAAAGSGF